MPGSNGIPRRRLESMSTLTNVGVLQFTDSVGFLSRDLALHFASQGALQRPAGVW